MKEIITLAQDLLGHASVYILGPSLDVVRLADVLGSIVGVHLCRLERLAFVCAKTMIEHGIYRA